MLKNNYFSIKNNINSICENKNIPPQNVTLIAVSKTKPISDIEQIYDAGCRDFGENKAQELKEKYERLLAEANDKVTKLDEQLNDAVNGNLDEAVNDLKQLLYFDYSGKTVAALDLFINHQIRTRYSRKHYISALRKLVAEKKIVSTFVDGKQHKVTVLLSKDCMLTFK